MDATQEGVERLATGRSEVKIAGAARTLWRTRCRPRCATIPATANDFAKRTPIHVLKRGHVGEQGRAGRPAAAERAGRPERSPELAADVPKPAARSWPRGSPHRPSADGSRDRQPPLAAPLRRRAS